MHGKTIVLVGAGASVAEAGTSSLQKTPPLDATFFRLCRRGGLVKDRKIQDYLHSTYGFDPFEGSSPMEEVFNLLYSDVVSKPPPTGSVEAYWSLLTLYRRAISRTTNHLTGNSRAGVGRLYRFLLRSFPDEEIVFITFNHDLVIEKAVQLASSTQRFSHVLLNLRTVYGITFERYPKPRAGTGAFSLDGSMSRTDVRIYKLHGSMNWLYPVSDLDDPQNAFRIPRGHLFCSNDSMIYPTYEISRREQVKELVPLVVPPVYEKSDHITRILAPVWNEARKEIESASKIIVFGYSMPDADLAARSMLRRSIHRNGHIRQLEVIDINPAVVAKITSILAIPVVSQYRGVADFRNAHMAA